MIDSAQKFLAQFDASDREIIGRLLKSFIYLDRQSIKRRLIDHFLAFEELGDLGFVALGQTTESGNELAIDLRRALSDRVAVEQFLLSDRLEHTNLALFRQIIVLDDFIGTGRQAVEYFERIPGKFAKKITYTYLTGLEAGVMHVRQYLKSRFDNTDVTPIFDIKLRSAFEKNYVFDSEYELELARAICVKYGNYLKSLEDRRHQTSYPLGYGDSAILFATEYNTPNNTLPIFWSTVRLPAGERWFAPYPRSHKLARIPPPQRNLFVLEHRMHEGHKFGSLVVPSIAKYQRFDPPLLHSEIRTALAEPKPLPPELAEYYTTGVEARIAELRARGKSVEINHGYSLHSARIDKIQVADSKGRKHIPFLEFEPADYSHQIMFGERIAEPSLIATRDGQYSIREFMEKDKLVSLAHFDWATVKGIPIPQRFANVVGLVVQRSLEDRSEGKCLIACLRSKAMAVSEEEGLDIWQATMSCAEGMLRPDDADDVVGAAPSPFNTARRALKSELGVSLGRDYKFRDLKMLALAYDSKRCQPVACFVLEISDIDYEMVENLWNTEAEDNNESPAIFPVPISPSAISSFLRGDFVWEGRTTRMFSNHQQIGLCALAEHYFPVKSLSV
jgi:hypothetical protein